VTAFHAPAPHGVRVGVVGPPGAAARARALLDPGAFTVKSYASPAAARRALLDDELRGVLVADPGRPQIVTASAFGLVPAQVTATALRRVAAVAHLRPARVDARPLPPGDTRGLSSFFTVVGTVIGGVACAILLTLLGGPLPLRARLAAGLLTAVAGGIAVALAVDTLVGALTGAFWGVAGIAALLVAAVVATVHGLGRLLGPPGLGIGFLTLVLVGVSSAGGGLGSQLQPGFYRALAPLLPDGAAVTAVRNTVYFGGAHTLGALAVLAAWTAGGVALMLAAQPRRA
jgi:hypothetical protein